MKRTISLVLVLALGLATEVANADFVFDTPTNLGPVINSSSIDAGPRISADGLAIFFGSDRPGGYGGTWGDIWVTTRATKDDEWGTPMNLGPIVNSSFGDAGGIIPADGLSLFFTSDRPGGYGGVDIWVTTRDTTGDDWGTPINLGPTVNSSADEMTGDISANGLQLYFSGWRAAYARPGGYGKADLWVTTRATKDDDWDTPVNLGPSVNSSTWDDGPSILADGLSLFFRSTRLGGYGYCDIWVTKRATTDDDWGIPVNLGSTVNSSAKEQLPDISADGSTLYFSSDRPGGSGGHDLWQVSIEPVVDLNGDGIVDSADMCIMVDHWHTDNALYDIAPAPFGDGIVDIQDLVVLSEYLFEDINDPTLIAHWALDETEGMVVADSAGDNNGYALGDPIWQPDGGLLDGAIQLDGVDDYVITGTVPNPAEGPISVLAWIKGGAAGQVIISQSGGGVNWLLADPSEGNLMTELTSPGWSGGPMLSQTNITDGNWHRIGFVWDGSRRTLYVDGVAVAQDTQDGLEGSYGGLYLGCGKAMEAGTFFSGLIDDVRIYNRAVRP
jgi:hypothetical protein